MRRTIAPSFIAAALTMGLAMPAAAQPTAAPASGETLLHLSDSATVMREPNEITATLRVEARAASAAAVQEQVNRAMTAALERARAVSGVQASTGRYGTWQNQDPPRAWHASQTLQLRGPEPAPLLELVGTLQGQGLALSDLSWRLTREAEREAREEASRLAIEALRRRAQAVAGQLGLGVAGIRELRLDAPEQPVPMPRMATMAASARASVPPPVAAPEEAPVSATASAVVVLRPN
jgi:predicted secreted protein